MTLPAARSALAVIRRTPKSVLKGLIIEAEREGMPALKDGVYIVDVASAALAATADAPRLRW